MVPRMGRRTDLDRHPPAFFVSQGFTYCNTCLTPAFAKAVATSEVEDLPIKPTESSFTQPSGKRDNICLKYKDFR